MAATGVAASTGTVGAATAIEGMPKPGNIKLDDITGFVEMEYGVKMVGDCIMDQGELMVGVTLMVGMTRGGVEEPAAAAAAAELLRLRRLPAKAPAKLFPARAAAPTPTGPPFERGLKKLGLNAWAAMGAL